MIGLEQKLMGTGFAAARDTIFQIVGRTEAHSGNPSSLRIVAAYDYRDESGLLQYQTVRLDPKDFKQRRPDGKGGWIWSLKGVRFVLYRLPELLKRNSETVFICEGVIRWAPANGATNTQRRCRGVELWSSQTMTPPRMNRASLISKVKNTRP
jgi:hypothetical protein